MQATLLINASNLHVGGGVQVATSFIEELSMWDDLRFRIIVAASSEVDNNLKGLGVDLSKFKTYSVINCSGLEMFLPELEKLIARADITFTVFGPLYLARKPDISVVGFAQPWIIYPNNEIYSSYGRLRRLLVSSKFAMHKFFYERNSDFIFVEANHVKERLMKFTSFREDLISVVPNCASEVFVDQAPRTYERSNPVKGRLKIGFLGRNYPHKNLGVLPEVRSILQSRHGLDVEFIVTLNDAEWSACSDNFRRYVTNVGALPLYECPDFYRKMDAIIFPSLLECFSATPLESMIMRKPLLASDRPFVRDFCGDFPFYFDPCAPDDIAYSVARFAHESEEAIADRTERAQSYVLAEYSPRERARLYMDKFENLLATLRRRD